MRSARLVLAFGVAVVAAPACVTTGTYDRKVAELTKLRADDAATAERQRARLAADIDKLRADAADQARKLADTEQALAAATTTRAELQRRLDDDAQLVATLKQRLEKVGQNVDSLVKERGALTKAMADTTARLEELRKQQAAAEARAATFRGLVAKLRSMIDAGQLNVAIRDGRMIIALPNDVLFDSGRTEVKPDGKAALARVASALAGVADRKFLVAGHTDNVPIHTELFPSNWELSTRRAVEVVRYLIAQGLSPKVVAAAGYGEFDPAVANDTPAHRAQNRRIEIVLQPNLSDLPALATPADLAAAAP